MYYLAVDLYDEDICTLEVHDFYKKSTLTIDSQEVFYESYKEFISAGRTNRCLIFPLTPQLYKKYKKFIQNFRADFSEKKETIESFLSSDFPEVLI